MTEVPEDPQDSSTARQKTPGVVDANDNEPGGLIRWVKNIVKPKSDPSLRETIEEFIDNAESNNKEITSVSTHERALISNILKLRDHTAADIMIPRADIFAIDINISQKDLIALLAEKQHSRIPVYRETLDDIVGTIHIKDILGCLATGNKISIEDLIRDVPIVSPSMQALDLLLMMKQMRKHMALVVDEFGGIDGLVTINDVIEAILGEIEDEHEQSEQPELVENRDGTLLADGRIDIDTFETQYGKFLTDEEREDIDTLGGLMFYIAGRVPARGEILTHESGMVFEIIDADPRRVYRLLVKNIPLRSEPDSP